MRRGAALIATLFVFVLECMVQGQRVQYFPPKCSTICVDSGEFEERLPQEPTLSGRNRLKQWSIVLLNQIRENFDDTTPPGCGRVLGVFTACLHDAVAQVTPYMTTAYAVDTYTENADLLLNHIIDGAAYEALSEMYSRQPSFKKVRKFLYQDLGRTPSSAGLGTTSLKDYVDSLGEKASISFSRGRSVCSEVLMSWKKDGFDAIGKPIAHTPNYEAVNQPQTVAGITDCDAELSSYDHWQPICVPVEIGSDVCKPQKFLGPLADQMHTYALESPDSIMPSGPPLLQDGASDEWQRQAWQVIEFSAKLNDGNKLIAEHWADGPDTTLPPGHMFHIAMGAAEKQGLNTFDTVKLYFLVGAALNDAGVGAWASKLKFDFTRPLQMIQCGFRGNRIQAWQGPYMGIGTIEASKWQPYQAETFVTPGFSGYVSGHSTFSAAAAGALINFFGTSEYLAPKCIKYEEGSSLFEGRINKGEKNYVEGMTDVPNQGPHTTGYVPATDVVLCWETFEEAAEDAGISRLHGGIHIIADHIDGNEMGFKIASIVYEKAKKLWDNF